MGRQPLGFRLAPRIQAASQASIVPLQLHLSHGLAWKPHITCSPTTGVPESQALASQRPLERTEFRVVNWTAFFEVLG